MPVFNKDPREEVIRSFYRNVLGREADEAGLNYYYGLTQPLDMIYMVMYTSEEAEKYRRKEEEKRLSLLDIGALPLTLAMFVKDNEDSVAMSINSVKSMVREIVVLDTGSTDNTVSICKDLGARVYQINTDPMNFDFGSIRTLTAHLARQDWVLGLDSDETILEEDYDILSERVLHPLDIEVWGTPRKRWLDFEMTTQLEPEVYPDWQYRLFRNKTKIHYDRRIHEIIEGSDKRKESPEGPHIHHFQDAFKTGARLEFRNKQYKTLQKLDIADGVEHEESAVQPLDER